MPLKKLAGIILYHPKKGILLILRNKKPFKNMWTFPGGHAEKGETPLETVKREVKEELGYDLKNVKYFCKKRRYNSLHYAFILKINKPLKRLKLGEGHKMAFIPFNKIDKIKVAFGNKIIITRFIKKYRLAK